MKICVAKKTCLRYFHEINQHLKYPLLLARQGFLFFMLNQCLCLDWRWNKRGHVFDRVTLPKSLPLRSPPSVRPLISVTFNHALGWTFSFATITADHMRFSGDPQVTGDSGKRPLYSLTHTRTHTHTHTQAHTLSASITCHMTSPAVFSESIKHIWMNIHSAGGKSFPAWLIERWNDDVTL